MPENDRCRGAEAAPPARTFLACTIWPGVALRSAHRVRHPAQQHDRDVTLAALELCDIAFGNAGHLCEHFSRHAAQRAHGADTLAELLQEIDFGIATFGHFRKDSADED